ncbi:hypothetical protein VPH35_042339 [Triticum aestivum]
MPHNNHIFSGILKLNRKRAEKRWPNLMQMGHAGEASLGPAWSANWIRSKRPGIAIPCQHPSPIPTTDAGGDCHSGQPFLLQLVERPRPRRSAVEPRVGGRRRLCQRTPGRACRPD